MEYIFYALIILFLKSHENPSYCFVFLSQFALQWKPDLQSGKDRRMETGDVWLGHFTCSPRVKLRIGIEAKKMLVIMQDLPDRATIEAYKEVRTAFCVAYLQGIDQAKAVFNKGNHQITMPMPFFLFVSPY
jgi:hypothetical protein